MALEIPHPRVADDKQTQNLDRLKPWADGIDGEIDAMPGSFAADSIDPSQVNVTTGVETDFSTRTLNSTSLLTLDTFTAPVAGIYTVQVMCDWRGSGSASTSDIYSFQLTVDSNNMGTSYYSPTAATFYLAVPLLYVGAVTSTVVIQAARSSGSGSTSVVGSTLRWARLG